MKRQSYNTDLMVERNGTFSLLPDLTSSNEQSNQLDTQDARKKIKLMFKRVLERMQRMDPSGHQYRDRTFIKHMFRLA